MASNALATQLQLEERAKDLVALHPKLQAGRGRRWGTEAINASGIVLLVAAWEGYVEALAKEAVEALRLAMAAHPALPIMDRALQRFDKFNTPNAEQVQNLFSSVIGLDLWPHWTWTTPRFAFPPATARGRLNEILQVRHSIAHGYACPAYAWLQHPQTGLYTLRKEHVTRTTSFFRKMSEITDNAVSAHLSGSFGIPKPW